jgi:glycosyltransferase involved in cell wall biosynthesis
MAPKHSFIVPVYNVVPFLNACLDSIQAQSERDWECLCIDDGSTDGSGAILDTYAQQDGRFKVIHQANAGVSAARNLGLSLAQGEWVSFVDSDDTIVEDYLEVFFKTPEKADINFLGIKQCFEDGGWMAYCSTSHGLIDTTSPNYYKTLYDYCVDPKKGNIGGFCTTKIFRKRLLELSGVRFVEGLSFQEDLYFTIEIFLHAKTLSIIPHVFYHYRVSTTGLTYAPFNKAIYFENYLSLLKRCDNLYLKKLICLISFWRLCVRHRFKQALVPYLVEWLPHVACILHPSCLRFFARSPYWLRWCYVVSGAFLRRRCYLRYIVLPGE